MLKRARSTFWAFGLWPFATQRPVFVTTSTPSKITATRSDGCAIVKPARLTALNFGIQTVWGAILAVSLQDRVISLTGGANATQTYALIAAGGALIATVSQIAAGVASDRLFLEAGNRRAFLNAGIAFSLPALFAFFAAPSIAWLAVAYALLEIGVNVIMAPFAAIVPDYVPYERRGRASGWLSGYGSFGGTAGLLIAGFVHPQLAIAAWLAAVLTIAFTVTVAHARTLTPLPVVREKPERGSLAVLLLSRGMINVGFFVALGFLLFFVRESLGIDTADAQRTQTALLFITFTTVAVAGAAAAGRVSDRVDKRLVVTLCCIVLMAGFLGVAAAQTPAQAYAAMALAGFAWGGFVVADWALAFTLLPRGSMAAELSIWNISNSVPQVIAPLLAAPIVAYADGIRYGLGPRVTIALCSLAVALGAALIWRLPRDLCAARPPA